jgi:light-regulated signal transduction histidine kinase (bacteriophytochrome)
LNIVNSCKQQYQVSNLEFVLGETQTILGERTLVYQLFLNLIGNAIKYSSKQIVPKVQVKSYRSGDSVYYQIKDNGIGMDLSEKDSILIFLPVCPIQTGMREWNWSFHREADS